MDPIDLLRDVAKSFSTNEEIASTERVSVDITRLSLFREAKLAEARDKLQDQIRQRDLCQESVAGDSTTSERTQHVHELEREKMRLARAINDLEETLNATQAATSKLNAELELVEKESQQPIESAVENDSSAALQLKLFRTLGVTFDAEKPENYTKCMIRSNTTSNVATLDLNVKEYSGFFITNYIWDKL
ncbi:putative kinetochore protein SPC24 [Yarrowia lipolytica]|jgi:predicted nuclease with TOPRIM domain|uniref:Kinetochore protein Spc24 n=1 Tax=Yarrowia lipolytica TaxID=4952 RepID=A0A371CFN7_YARLL|nr:Putative kinetochore protein SPC24 [Yarrowia lipolytica]RDW29097.1 putative kinetochore protein SPC24 [Yarrowia lipolytica]RDW33431.1 putative kinetochore protein SPC24 [Yarrowia lipolytica]RDW41473.1 putative kinetochore protein SPC24 [Yarrowia lipolytica]RDW47664.1 putative kinetochore protein SPC24 [Yarrowia lipolytica]